MEEKKIQIEIVGSVFDGKKYLQGVLQLPESQALSLVQSKHAKLVPIEVVADPPVDPPSDPPETSGEEEVKQETEEAEPTFVAEAKEESKPLKFGRRGKN